MFHSAIAFRRKYDFMFECILCVWLPLRLPCATSTSQLWLLNRWRGEVSAHMLPLWLLFAAWFSMFVPMCKYLCKSNALIFLLWCVHHCKHGKLQPEHPITAFVYLSLNLSFSLTHHQGGGMVCVCLKMSVFLFEVCPCCLWELTEKEVG